MPVQITINGADAAESLKELSALAAGLTGAASASVVVEPTGKPKRTTKGATKPDKPADPVEETESKPDEADPDQTDETDDAVEEITDVDLRAKASEVAKSGKQAEVKALLTEFGVPNVTALPQNKRAQFMKRLGDL